MAAGTIFTVLSNIPWGAVVENAPKVADGAVKLWKTVAGGKTADAAQSGPTDAPPQAAKSEGELLAARLQTMEERLRQLHEQMQASSELLKDLAEQNTLLVQRVELNRRRLARLAGIAGVAGALLLGLNLYLLFLR